MAKYYYDKYMVEEKKEWHYPGTTTKSSLSGTRKVTYGDPALSSSVKVNSSSMLTGTGTSWNMAEVTVGLKGYIIYGYFDSKYGGSSKMEYGRVSFVASDNSYFNVSLEHVIERDSYSIIKKVKGNFINSVIAKDGTYPNNGVKGDYWYVKREKAPDIKANVNGEARDISKVYVNINGQRREVTSMYANINGQAKEVLYL